MFWQHKVDSLFLVLHVGQFSLAFANVPNSASVRGWRWVWVEGFIAITGPLGPVVEPFGHVVGHFGPITGPLDPDCENLRWPFCLEQEKLLERPFGCSCECLGSTCAAPFCLVSAGPPNVMIPACLSVEWWPFKLLTSIVRHCKRWGSIVYTDFVADLEAILWMHWESYMCLKVWRDASYVTRQHLLWDQPRGTSLRTGMYKIWQWMGFGETRGKMGIERMGLSTVSLSSCDTLVSRWSIRWWFDHGAW